MAPWKAFRSVWSSLGDRKATDFLKNTFEDEKVLILNVSGLFLYPANISVFKLLIIKYLKSNDLMI